MTTSGERDLFIVKLDATGGFDWYETVGDPSRQDMGQLVIDSTGNVYSASFGYGSFSVPTVVGGPDDVSVDLGVLPGRSGLVWKIEQATTPANTPPTALDDVAETTEDTPVVIDVLANDRDAEHDSLTVDPASVSGPTAAGSSVVLEPEGTLTYTPAGRLQWRRLVLLRSL